MKKITFWSHPITYTWNALSNAVSGKDDTILLEDDIKFNAPGTPEGKVRITCVVSQILVFSAFVYFVFTMVKSKIK